MPLGVSVRPFSARSSATTGLCKSVWPGSRRPGYSDGPLRVRDVGGPSFLRSMDPEDGVVYGLVVRLGLTQYRGLRSKSLALKLYVLRESCPWDPLRPRLRTPHLPCEETDFGRNITPMCGVPSPLSDCPGSRPLTLDLGLVQRGPGRQRICCGRVRRPFFLGVVGFGRRGKGKYSR